jgi:hypothetical protein
LHVLTGGKSLAPVDEECGDWAAFAGIESATALSSLGAFDIEAPRLVFKPWPFFVATYRGLVELFSDLFICGHGFILRINCQIRWRLQPIAMAFSAAVLLRSINVGSIFRLVAM